MSLSIGSGPLAGSPAGEFNFDLQAASPAHRIYFVPEPRRVRAFVGGTCVLDTTRAQLLYETGIAPRVYAPLDDYAAALLTPTETTTHCPFKGDASYWTVTVGSDAREDALWGYVKPLPPATFLAGHGALYANKVDEWRVEDDVVRGGLRDPFHRVDVHDSSREVVVSIGGREIVRTTRAKLLFETGLPVRAYVPRGEVSASIAAGSGKRTICPYKGEASYWTVDGVTDAAWSYEFALPEAQGAQRHLSFDSGLDGVEVQIA